MTLNQQKEQLSAAYVLAVASAAQCSVKEVKVDDDSIDLTIVSKQTGKIYHAPELNIQLKATARASLCEDKLTFPLKVKNYDELRIKTLVPRILVVMVVPDTPELWIRQAEFKTQIYRCAYWVNLFGKSPSPNCTSISVELPRENIFTPAVLSRIMSTIADGDMP